MSARSTPSRRCRGGASTSARRSTTRSRRSCTSPSTCRRRVATGSGTAQIEEIGGLLEAAGGRTLGLFSSRRAAEAAAEALRERLPHLPILCQGDGQLSHLQAEFVANPAVSLFGTLSLWQGLDVPGETCQLVIIDRIPFPRPDDPLMSARARAAERAGGNGFMAVSATHAALLLAQGAGRLIRTKHDRGVVAILDPRIATARYGGVLAGVPAPDVDDLRPRRRSQRPGATRSGMSPGLSRRATDPSRRRSSARRRRRSCPSASRRRSMSGRT